MFQFILVDRLTVYEETVRSRVCIVLFCFFAFAFSHFIYITSNITEYNSMFLKKK